MTALPRSILNFDFVPECLAHCIAPMVWAFLSTTVHLHATHRKVEGGERDTQLVHVNGANSCFARGYCVSQAAQGERRLSSPPLPLQQCPPPLFKLNLCDFQHSQPKARTAFICKLKSVAAKFGQLLWLCTNLNWSDRTLMSRVRFLIFPRKKVEIFAAANIWQGANILAGCAGTTSRYSTAETPPI